MMFGDTSPASKHMTHIKGIVEVVCTMRGKDAQERVRVAHVCKEAVLNFQAASSAGVQLDGGITGNLEAFNSEGYVVVNGPCVQVLDPEMRPVSIQMAPDISTIAALRDSNGILVIIGKCQLRNKRVGVVLDMFSDQNADLVIDDYQNFKDKRQEETKLGQQGAIMDNSSNDECHRDINKIQNETGNEHFKSNIIQYRAFVIEGFPIEMDTEQLKHAIPEDERAFIHDIQRINNDETPSTSVYFIWKSFDQSPPDTVTLCHDKADTLTLTLKEVEKPVCFKCLVLGQQSCLCDENQISCSERDKEKDACTKDLSQESKISIEESSAQHEDPITNTEFEAKPVTNELAEKLKVAEKKATDGRDCNERSIGDEEYKRILLENDQMKHQLDSYEKRVQELESLINELQEEIAILSCTKSVDTNPEKIIAADVEQQCTVS